MLRVSVCAVAVGAVMLLGPAAPAAREGSQREMVRVEGDRVLVETGTLTAVIEKGSITSLRSRRTGEEFIRPFDVSQEAALQLLYRSWDLVQLNDRAPKEGEIRCLQLSPDRAQVIFHCWDGDGVIEISTDPESGDLVIEPSAYSSRPGVVSCRWVIRGLREDLELVAPVKQGLRLPLDDPLIKGSRWEWPMFWEAQLAILQGDKSGLWVHSQDTRFRYKALRVGSESDAHALGLETEAYGPVEGNLGAGGVAWGVNVYDGDWRVPAARYRDWLWKAYDLAAEERKRPAWLPTITLALSWCPTDPDLLDALAQRVPPERVLLHVPNWRTDQYDENYPAFVASDEGKAFIRKARAMGFHAAPHFNTVDMDPTHPVYPLLRDFQYRDLWSGRLHGWGWADGGYLSVPESNLARTKHRDKKVMVKIHPGLAMWRSVLGESILAAAQDLPLDTVFTDVSLCVSNLQNAMVEGMTPAEGMLRLIRDVSSLGDGLAVGGEGLNEITMQGLTFAQAHLLTEDPEQLKRPYACDLNQFLWGKLCRIIGYTHCGGQSETDRLVRAVYDAQGAIPTLTVGSAEEITSPTPEVEEVLRKAGR